MPQASLASPALGWNTRDPIADMKPGFAPILDNYVVEGGAPRVRRGWRVWSTGLPGRVDGLLSWAGAGATPRLFASSGAGIYEITAGGAVGAAVVSGLTSARWDGINVAATGGNFLFAFNGTNTPQTFDGTTWAAWTGTGVTGGVAWAGQVGGRLIVGNPSRLSFFYSGAGAIAGAFTEFPLQGVAQRGGGVVAVTSLSVDGGAGPQTLTVFITSEGEAVVYAGTDPSSTSTWALVGRWRIAQPVGAPHRCVANYGGDALLMTEIGALPLSSLRNGADIATALDRSGTVRRIAPTWRELTRERGSVPGWQIMPLTNLALIVMNVPWTATSSQQIVVSEGGALTRWTGVPAASWIEHDGRSYFGDAATGRVLLYGEDNADNGGGVRSEAMMAYTSLGAPSRLKVGQLVQVVMRDALGTSTQVRVLSNLDVPTPVADSLGPAAPAPAVPPISGAGAELFWDVGLWDVNVWGGGANAVSRHWRAAAANGHMLAPRVTMVSGNGRPAWVGTNMVYEFGGPVR